MISFRVARARVRVKIKSSYLFSKTESSLSDKMTIALYN